MGSCSRIYFAQTGMDLADWAEGAAAIGMTTTVVMPKLTWQNLVFSNLAVLIVVMVVSLYPALHAARLQPVEAVRHV